MNAKKGDWVRIYKVILPVGERADNLPEDTQHVPLEMWDKGFLLDEAASIGDTVSVETMVGRHVQGQLVELHPNYEINYGNGVTETLYIGRQLRQMLEDA